MTSIPVPQVFCPGNCIRYTIFSQRYIIKTSNVKKWAKWKKVKEDKRAFIVGMIKKDEQQFQRLYKRPSDQEALLRQSWENFDFAETSKLQNMVVDRKDNVKSPLALGEIGERRPESGTRCFPVFSGLLSPIFDTKVGRADPEVCQWKNDKETNFNSSSSFAASCLTKTLPTRCSLWALANIPYIPLA